MAARGEPALAARVRVSGQAPRGAAVLSRTTSSVGTSVRAARARRPRSRAGAPRRERRPTSAKSWCTVVSGGQKCAASAMSSKPTTLTSPGTARPALVQGAQHAERHLVVGGEDGGDLGVARRARARLVARTRPTSRREHRRHRRRRASRSVGSQDVAPVARRRTSARGRRGATPSRGPRSSRCSVASRAPCAWSVSTTGSRSRARRSRRRRPAGPAAASTSASSSRCASMMMMTPSTACSLEPAERARHRALGRRRHRHQGDRVAGDRSAAMAIASRVRMLPKLDSVNMITPMLRNRPLRSARAALFGR